MANCAPLVFRLHQVFRRDAMGIGKPSGDKNRATYRRIHSRRDDDDAVGQFGEGVTETGANLASRTNQARTERLCLLSSMYFAWRPSYASSTVRNS